MGTVYEIPTSPAPQSLQVAFPNGNTYQLRLTYLFTENDCWNLDIADANGNALVSGIPLVTGADLLAQYEYLGLGCSLYCTTDGDADAPPRFFNLGVTAHLWLESPPGVPTLVRPSDALAVLHPIVTILLSGADDDLGDFSRAIIRDDFGSVADPFIENSMDLGELS